LPLSEYIKGNEKLFFNNCLASDFSRGSNWWMIYKTRRGYYDNREALCYKQDISGKVVEDWGYCGIRPVIELGTVNILPYAKLNSGGNLEVEFGEFPQKRVDSALESELNKLGSSSVFCEYQGKKYQWIKHAWFEFQPIKWLLNEKNNTLVCKNVISTYISSISDAINKDNYILRDLEEKARVFEETRCFLDFFLETLVV